MNNLKLACAFLLLLVVVSCSTTKITSLWKSPDFTGQNFNKIMVVGIVNPTERAIRERMETHLTEDLKAEGLNAYSAYQVYGPKVFEGMNEALANEKLSKEGVDAVVTVVLLDKQQEKYYVPGRVVFTPYFNYHRRFWGYYRSMYTRIESPGYYQERTRFFWESNIYDLTTNKLIYSVQTESFEPASTDDLAHQYGLTIVNSIIKNNILKAAEKSTNPK